MEKNENIELTQIVSILKNKKLIILFILVIFVLLGYWYSYHYVVPKYKAVSSLLLIPNSSAEGSHASNSNIMVNSDLTVNSELIETYRSIGENSKVLKQVIHNLELNMTEQELLKELKISVMKDTYLIQVTVTNESPEKAMKIIQEFDTVFLKEIKEIYHLNNIGIVDEVQYPEEPYNINHAKDLVLFSVIGMSVAFAYIMAIYLFDNTIKKEEELERYIQIKSLGSIPIYENKKQEIVNRDDAKSYIIECINTIRTNILYMNSAKNSKVILITSCTPREGKSWVSANIATSFAEIHKKVLLIDSDMRKGRAHKIFEVEKEEGLSNYLSIMTEDRTQNIMQLGKKYIKETQIPNLHLLTSGTIPPNPSELLESNNMKQLLEIVRDMYDIIIVDAPPCKLVTDSIILSTIVDATILLANAERTKIRDLKEVRKSIQMVNGEIIGSILNRKKVTGRIYKKRYYYTQTEKENKEQETEVIYPIDEIIKEAILKNSLKTEEKQKQEEKKEEKESTSKIERILERIEAQGLTKEQVEQIMKDQLIRIEQEKLTEKQIENIVKEEMIKIKNVEQQMELLLNEKMSEMQQETQKLLQEEILKINYKEQIAQINDMLNNLKDSYLELANKMKTQEGEKTTIEEEEKNGEKNRNVIDFRTLRRQRNKKKVYSIYEDIYYEDLEKTAICVIPIHTENIIKENVYKIK